MCHVNIDHVFFWQSVYNVLSFLYKWKTMTCSLLCRLAEWFCLTWDSWLFDQLLSRYCTKKTSHCLITTTVRNPICSKHSNIRIAVVFPCSMAPTTTIYDQSHTEAARVFNKLARPTPPGLLRKYFDNGLYSYRPLTWYHWHTNKMTQNSIQWSAYLPG